MWLVGLRLKRNGLFRVNCHFYFKFYLDSFKFNIRRIISCQSYWRTNALEYRLTFLVKVSHMSKFGDINCIPNHLV